ncbi:ABI family, member 3 (NESH) binding protein b isoform X1 [Cyprinus carpio]|uniref:ABI family, member 3 (NESH) binding protein b isoform X1 n=1 Tax=Cyprinus carpio TaxID=7962 RepID=A0A9R0ANC7_CYPCA|nr:ABI family, member 3 (NESH) binding protein b isoform X1 [Cyprinus carpio]
MHQQSPPTLVTIHPGGLLALSITQQRHTESSRSPDLIPAPAEEPAAAVLEKSGSIPSRLEQSTMAGSTVLHLGFLLMFAGILLLPCSSAQRVRVRRQNMKVRINATGDTIVLKFVRPNPDVKLEGYILGYGSSMFSKQFIQLPENGEPYETEIDAEPKYLVAVQPIPTNDVKKHCTGKVNLDKPLHLVIDSVTPTSVLLSWGTYLKTPYEGNIMNECLEEGHYTIRYRERNRKWIYQTCPTSDTVIDNLKPNTPYEFGVRSNKDDRSGMWSKPVIHNTNMGEKNKQITYKQNRPIVKTLAGTHSSLFPLRPAVVYHNISQPGLPKNTGINGGPKTSFAPPMGQQGTVAAPRANEPKWPQLPLDSDSHVRNDSSQLLEILPILPQLLSTKPSRPSVTPTPYTLPSSTRTSPHGHSQTSVPSATQMPHSSSGTSIRRDSISSLPSKPIDSILTVTTRNQTSLGRYLFSLSNGMRPSSPRLGDPSRKYGANGEHHKGLSLPKPAIWSRTRMGSPAARLPIPAKQPNLVGKPGGIDKITGLSQDKASILKPKLPPVTAKLSKPKTTSSPTVTAPQFETWENSSVFSSVPASKVDAMGKERYIAPHVVYKTDKKPDEPCSITTSLSYFPEEEAGEQNVTNPPRTPPSNLTVVTVEGCPSFIILDWEKTDNETTEYEVISTTKGPDGEQVSILTTNQTHTAVENLLPDSSYEFKVKPKNELGEGPPSEPVTFNTESADPRVSENVSGKDAIWTQFPFKTDSYSECNGKQYVKRTWYRKFVGIQLCNSLRYKIYLSDSLNGKFYNIGDQTGHGEDHCQFVDSFLDGRTGTQLPADQLPTRPGFYRAMRQEPVHFGQIGGTSHVTYVAWYECGTPIPGKW